MGGEIRQHPFLSSHCSLDVSYNAVVKIIQCKGDRLVIYSKYIYIKVRACAGGEKSGKVKSSSLRVKVIKNER